MKKGERGIHGPDQLVFVRQHKEFGFNSKWYVPMIRK